MPDLVDYVRWRGDLTFAERGFNDADNLVLTALSYLDLRGVVPTTAQGGAVTVERAAELAVDRPPDEDHRRLTVVPAGLLGELARSERFRSALLSAFVDTVDPVEGVQFSAVTIDLDDGSRYVAYRGTDNTLLGWREDFLMSVRRVPAQVLAAAYLADRADASGAPLRVGGHSKGGSLAAFAAMSVPPHVQERIVAVVNLDGPALAPEVLDPEGWSRVVDRVVKVVPAFTVIGALFEPEDYEPVVVRSTARGLLQHDLTTWQVEGTHLATLPAVTPRSVLLHGAFRSWMQDAGIPEREEFTHALFDALGAGGATLITDVASHEHGSVESIMIELARTGGGSRRTARMALSSLRRSLLASDLRALLRDQVLVRGAVTSGLGVLLVLTPTLGLPVLGAFTFAVLIGTGLVRLTRSTRRRRGRPPRVTARRLLAALVAAGACVAVFSHVELFAAPMRVVLALGFFAVAVGWTRRSLIALYAPPGRQKRAVIGFAAAVVSLLFGVVVLTTAAQALPFLVQQSGHLCIIMGALQVFFSLKDRVVRQYDNSLLTRAGQTS